MPGRKKMNVAVTGMNGQLGRELSLLAPQYPGLDFLFLSRETFPLNEPEEMNSWLDLHPVDAFINCAAYTAVDKAEAEADIAFAVNGLAPGVIATRLAKHGGKFIQLSTDYVFDGVSSTPLDENAPVNPLNVYGASKLKGEQLAMAGNPNTLVIRTSWLYSAFGNNFVKTMMRLMKTKESIQVVCDQRGTPTYAGDLARAILGILTAPQYIPGIYHYSNEGETTWYEFALEIKKITGSPCTVLPVKSSGYPTAAKRPAYSLLNKSKIKRDYKLSVPDWKSSLAICVNTLLKSGV